MAFTLPTNYSNALSSPFKENILVRLYYDASNYTSIALYDQTVSSVSYTGCILNSPTIRQNIDLKKSTAKSGNINLNCADVTIGGTKLSAILIGGSDKYLNRKVEIYSILNDSTSSTDQLKIYTGRLQSVQHDHARVRISIVEHRPYDFIDVPNIKSDTGVYIPMAYGDFSGNSASTGLTSSTSLYPAPLAGSKENRFYYHPTNNIASSAVANYYDSTNDYFPFLASDSASITLNGKDALGVGNVLTRTYRIRPASVNDSNQWTNGSNAIDTDNTTYADKTVQTFTNTASEVTSSLYLDLPNLSGKITSAILYIKADVTYTEQLAGVQGTVAIKDDSFGNNNTIISQTDTDGTASTSGYADPDGTGTAYSRRVWTSDVAANDNKLPDTIKINVSAQAVDDGFGYTLDAEGKVYDIYLVITTATDYANEPLASASDLPQKIYIANDGLSKSWSSGAATKIHEFHRDILYRFLDITATPTNWSALDTARTSWTGRLFADKPKSIKSVLQKLQYEGGFIFLFNQDTPKYIFIPDSITPDHANITQSKINNLKISHTGIGDLITKMNIGYDKHPAKSEYLSSATYTSAERSDFNFSTNENVVEVNLDSLNAAVTGGANRNSSFANYYDKITGTLKTMISCDVADPTLGAKMEVGDFCTFDNSNMDTKVFASAWTSKNYIITGITRKMGAQLSVEMQEV